MNIIPAKPTTYKGTTYRSVCEARWAVYFDMSPLYLHMPTYEQEFPETDWRPDFWYWTESKSELWEIKPKVPSPDYILKMSNDMTSIAAGLLSRGRGMPKIFLGVGSFWNDVRPDVWELRGRRWERVILVGDISVAVHYRFDLEEESYPDDLKDL